MSGSLLTSPTLTALSDRPTARAISRRSFTIRFLVAANLLLGAFYLSWRYTSSINWQYWPIALCLVAAETYSYLDAWLFGLTMWRLRVRGEPLPYPERATTDVFITCYNEPVELVRKTARAAVGIRYPHQTYVLDDGTSTAMRTMAAEQGAGYIVRNEDWKGRPHHAKAGNLNNALLQTSGEFILVLDADQIPSADILDRTLGYFADPKVAFVQTPQYFYNVPLSDPLGSQAPLFYGPIQQGKDGWNAAFFCGSNAVLRREALMQLGVRRYVDELDRQVKRALRAADRLLRQAARHVKTSDAEGARGALTDLRLAARQARAAIDRGEPVQQATWRFQRCADEISRRLVNADLDQIQAELASLQGFDEVPAMDTFAELLDEDTAATRLANRDVSPLASIEAVRGLLQAVDLDRSDEAQPVMPLATISVTEDMATAMRLHSLGWQSVFHSEVLAQGLAPEDLGSSLQQRLRWCQGTLQGMLRENPLLVRGLGLGQRLMYLATMWTYLSGFFSVIYLSAPILFLVFGWLPVRAYSFVFFGHLLPFLLVNQLLFVVASRGLHTWRGQQYSLALFPLWIRAFATVVGTYFGGTLGFVVTPKTRQEGGSQLGPVRVQIVTMILLAGAAAYGLVRVAMGLATDWPPVLLNGLWIGYDLACLSVVLGAARYRPAPSKALLPLSSAQTTMSQGILG